jgi:dihydrofolate reductase
MNHRLNMLKSIIVAKADNQVIGNNNQMPWHLPNDLKHFRQTTLGHHVVMGRKTFESLPKTLTGRKVIIVSHNPNYEALGCMMAKSLIEALSIAEQAGETEVFIAGGGSVYQEALPLADQIYLTEIKASIPGDTFFPLLDAKVWTEVGRTCHDSDDQHVYGYDFVKLVRNH